MQSSPGLSSEVTNVLRILDQRGYTQSAQQLRLELRGGPAFSNDVSVGDFALQIYLDGQTHTHRPISSFNASQLDVEDYSRSYKRLTDIIGSNALYKNELSQLRYPVLCGMYMELLKTQDVLHAKNFLTPYYYSNLTPEQQRTLVALTSQVDVRRKVELQLSQVALSQLAQELTRCDDCLLARVIHENVVFEIPSKAPTLQDDVNSINETDVHWGLLEDVVHCYKMAREKVKEQDRPTNSSAFEGDLRNTIPVPSKTIKKDLIPLPAMNYTQKQRLTHDLRFRQPLSQHTLPSIAFFTFLNSRYKVSSVCISEDGSKLAGGFSDSKVRLWDMKKIHPGEPHPHPSWKPEFEQVHEPLPSHLAPKQTDPEFPGYSALVGHCGPVYGLAFSPDQQFLLSASEDNTIRLWDLESETNLVAYKGHTYPVWQVAFCSMSLYFASCSFDGTALLWQTDKIYPLRMFAGHTKSVDCLTFHPNCNYLVTGSSDETVRLWDLHDGQCKRLLLGPSGGGSGGGVRSVSVSQDGKQIASGGMDGRVKVWDIGTSKLIHDYEAHSGPVNSVAFGSDGGILASGSQDQSVKLWNPKVSGEDVGTSSTNSSKECLKSFKTKNSPVVYLHFTQRNLLLAAGIFQTSSESYKAKLSI